MSLKTLDSFNVESMNNSLRPSIDLICVIDKSGSMKGEKMFLVKDTLKYLVELLNEKDRISIVEFEAVANRILPLVSVS